MAGCVLAVTGREFTPWLIALTFGSETGKWLLIFALLLVVGMPALALLGIY